MDSSSVLVVDDHELMFDLIQAAIGKAHELDHVASGEACLDYVQGQKPDIILLDIEMDGIDGYETCRRLKQSPDSQDIWVIFISGRDSLDERLAGYDAGGDDYVVKPLNGKELLNKINIAHRALEEKRHLAADATMAMSTAMTALTASGEFGVVLKFLGASYKCHQYEELADEILRSMAEYNLNASVQIRTSDTNLTRNSTGTSNPLEEALLLRMIDQGRILEYGNRLILNFPEASLLVKDPPLEDPDKVGRLRDTLAMLLEGAVSRIQAINGELELARQHEALDKITRKTQQALHDIEAQNQQQKKRSMDTMDELMQGVEELFMTLGLTEEQEQLLLNLIQKSVDKALNIYEKGLEVDDHLKKIVSELQQVVQAGV